MEDNENPKLNLKQYKGHFRKFPWALIIRIFVAGISIAIIFTLIQLVEDLNQKRAVPEKEKEFEIQIGD